ncbi:serine/threonine protein kinase [Mesonia hippocampi]|uniref:Serine/threonine protein kinase n=1 Tax=Mesonia hippocampi TaxID=1628250 RepID=A0A840EGX2_9FLAO|nr:serine/threonine protein kinase [Mesonia hippocampi]
MNWKDKYDTITRNFGGGQGDCFVVQEKETALQYFLKKLKDNSSERRSRFFRETTLFKSLNVEGVPKITDTNVDEFAGDDELFYCAEFIDGERLDNYVQKNKINEIQLVDFSLQLFHILQKLHSQDIVHRDIKPENIIISNLKVYLVDFGIGVEISDKEKLTKSGQEIGNRFLRLPEFSAGSTSKRDIRSDITLAAGVVLFMITRSYPRNLVNENGQYPHQTRESLKILVSLENSFYWNNIFDRAFQQDISKRWSLSNDIIEILEQMKDKTHESEEGLIDIEKGLELHAKSIQNRDFSELKRNLTELNILIGEEVSSLINTKAKGFRQEKMGWVYNLGEPENKNQIRVYPIGKKEHVTINIITRIIGEQIIGIIEVNDEYVEICRVKTNDSLDKYQYQKMCGMINAKLLPKLIELINNNR